MAVFRRVTFVEVIFGEFSWMVSSVPSLKLALAYVYNASRSQQSRFPVRALIEASAVGVLIQLSIAYAYVFVRMVQIYGVVDIGLVLEN